VGDTFKGVQRICASKFYNLLNSYVINSSTQKNKNISSNKHIIKPWITAGLIHFLIRKNKLGKSTKNRPNNIQFLNYFKRYEYKLCLLIRKAKNDYYRNEVMSINNCDKYNNISATKQVCYNIIRKIINKYNMIKITEPFYKLYMKMN